MLTIIHICPDSPKREATPNHHTSQRSLHLATSKEKCQTHPHSNAEANIILFEPTLHVFIRRIRAFPNPLTHSFCHSGPCFSIKGYLHVNQKYLYINYCM